MYSATFAKKIFTLCANEFPEVKVGKGENLIKHKTISITR